MTDSFKDYDPAALPAPVVTYLDAHDEHRHADALAVFAPDATVRDEGNTYEGIEAIGAWMEKSSSAYTYTSTRIGQRVIDDSRVVVRARLDGNFPGGTATLRFQFDVLSGLIARMVIEV